MLLSSSNRKYQPYPLSYFSVVVCLRCLLHQILSLIAYTFRENRDFVFIIIVQFMMTANIRIRFGLQIVFVHYTISLSSLCKLIWGHWNSKMPVRYILSSVWVRLSIFSQLSIIQCMRLCVFSLPISLVMIERIYTFCLIIIIKSEVWTIIHCLGLGHETMVCAVCLSIFFWIWLDPSRCIQLWNNNTWCLFYPANKMPVGAMSASGANASAGMVLTPKASIGRVNF